MRAEVSVDPHVTWPFHNCFGMLDYYDRKQERISENQASNRLASLRTRCPAGLRVLDALRRVVLPLGQSKQ